MDPVPQNRSPINNVLFTLFYTLTFLTSLALHTSWCSGSGGGCSTRSSLTGSSNILVAPSGVQKEMMSVDDIIILDSTSNVIENCNDLKPSACLSIFNEIYLNSPSCSAIIHSHSSVFVKLTNLFLGAEFKCQYFEMIKGVQGHENDEVLVIPIIDNTRTEEELASSVAGKKKLLRRVLCV